ncbi:MAG: low-specificity L-threonine aldolase [Dehalococcoidales bacterium]|nr:low-specificity L-threonine aldolase [Dehalococcoidales bacterium]
MNKTIDLRSDTVTQPTPAMREAMYRAELGDDVFGEDPSINRLETTAAEKMGKEAALFVASGTMANLVSVLTHTQRGDEVILGSESHILEHELGSAATFGGLQMRAITNAGGKLDPIDVAAAMRPQEGNVPRTGLICLENTHNRCGGVALTAEYTATISDIGHRNEVPVHLDGARIFNAAVALGVQPKALTASVDSVAFCLSKGLSCPVGSLVCGSAEFIQRARKYRKMVGGGMRQAGILAAAGIVALEQMIDRLAEDHENARILAYGLAEIPGISLNPATVQSNIVVFELVSEKEDPAQFVERLGSLGLKTLPFGGRRVRAVTHYGISRSDVDDALSLVRQALA